MAVPTIRNTLKEKLERGEVGSSMAVRLIASNEIVLVARTAGFDSIYIDLEHSSLSIETAGRIALTALGENLTCLVRVPANRQDYISRVLDGGALGIIVPDVRNADEARAAVAAAKFAPFGKRGVSGALPQFGYRNVSASEGFAAINAATLVIVQCESHEAVENAASIARVDGVDMILVGANDLLADKGLPGKFDDPYVKEAYERVIAACLAAGKYAGIGGLAARPQLMADFVKRGARFISMGTDLNFLLDAATAKARWVSDLPR